MEDARILVHVSFAPDGATQMIGERPDWASPNEWFSLLCKISANGYQPLAGGRGLFCLRSEDLEALKMSAPA